MIVVEKAEVDIFHKMIEDSSVVTVTAHIHPDGDAVGSTVAMDSFLRMLGKDSGIVLTEKVKGNISFIDAERRILSLDESREKAFERIRRSNLIICLDCNDFDRTGELEDPLVSSTGRKVLIDHHPDPSREHFSEVFSTCEISSACELLFWILMEMPEINGDPSRLPQEAAQALMSGMTTDTNNFGNSVYPSTFRMASLLLAAGVDREKILERLYSSFRENRLRAMGWLLKDEMTITGKGVAYMILTDEIMGRYDLAENETDGFVNLPLSIKDVRMSVLAKRDGDHYRISLRSKKGTSANECAKCYFNGGGHEQASGGRLFSPKDIASCKREDVAEYIEKVTDEFFR